MASLRASSSKPAAGMAWRRSSSARRVIIERAEGASRRARHFGSYGYRALKNILVRGLDLEPLPAAVAPPGSPQESFRFARSAAELLHEWTMKHEPH